MTIAEDLVTILNIEPLFDFLAFLLVVCKKKGGAWDGCIVGLVDGCIDNFEGVKVGEVVGDFDGFLDGKYDGNWEGTRLGFEDAFEGLLVGDKDLSFVGSLDGSREGMGVTLLTGAGDGLRKIQITLIETKYGFVDGF